MIQSIHSLLFGSHVLFQLDVELVTRHSVTTDEYRNQRHFDADVALIWFGLLVDVCLYANVLESSPRGPLQLRRLRLCP